MPIAKLDRSVFRLSGDNLKPWLGGLITNTLDAPLTFAALLTPQGKIIADFFILQDGDDCLLETAPKFAPALFKRLKMYKLREKIEITDVSETYHVYALWDGHGDIGETDPRLGKLGQRLITQDIIETTSAPEDYDLHRLGLSIPDSQYDFETETTFPANANMDRLNGVDFKKGCFVGQEVASRMHRKTDIRKRMQAVTAQAPLELGQIYCGERVVGDILYTSGHTAMAMLRLDRLAQTKEPPQLESGLEIEIIAAPAT